MELTGEAWAKVYLSTVAVHELIEGDEITVTSGDPDEVVRVLNVFDRHDPAKAVVIPATTLTQGHM